MSDQTYYDPFAFAGDGDARVLSLFRDWLDASRESDQHGDDEEAQWDAALDRQDEIEDKIVATPGGPIALAVKAYLFVRPDLMGWAPDNATLRPIREIDGACPHDRVLVSLLRDAATQVPELAELAAPIIHEDAALIDTDIEIQWCQEMLRQHDLGTPLLGISDAESRNKVLEQLSDALERILQATPAKTHRGAEIKARHASAAIPIRSSPLARKREAQEKQFLELYRSATEQGQAEIHKFTEAASRLFTARNASEFAKARQDLLALAAKLPNGPARTQTRRWITSIRPRYAEKNKVVQLRPRK